MTIREVEPDIDRSAVLAGAQFADAFRVEVDGTGLDARGAAERMFARNPRWIEGLLNLRNMIVAPLGLKRSGAREPAPHGMIGIFPVLSETPQRLVAGFNDHHLDFRVVIEVAAAEAGQQITATTLVLTHNLLGRAYLKLIMPFHRLIVRTLLQRAAGSVQGV